MRPHKYRARPCMIDGVRFASQREGARYLDLKMLEKAGVIRELELQPKFPLYAVRACNGEVIKVCDYVADSTYREVQTNEDGYSTRLVVVVEDVKGIRTAMYRLKKKLFEAQYGITIREV